MLILESEPTEPAGNFRLSHASATATKSSLTPPHEELVSSFLCPPLPKAPCAASGRPSCVHLCTGIGHLQAPMPLKANVENQVTARGSKFLQILRTYISSCQKGAPIPVVLQVGKAFLGSLSLPGKITPRCLEECWRLASTSTGTWPNARIYSGPLLLAFSTPLELQKNRLFYKRTVGLVITVVPEVRGGGAKDDNYQLAVSKLASTCLERGVPLERASAAAQALVKGAGAKACLHAQQSGDAKEIWISLQGLAKSHSVEWPEADNRTERAAKRIQRAIRKKQLQNHMSASTNSFRLGPSVWLGMDEMPVQLLDKIELRTTGIYFTDAHESSKEDLALWAVTHSDASRHLLACCFHQVGSTPIRPTFAVNAQVDVTTTVVCSFEMQKDDLPANKNWTDLVQGPVRAVQAAFASEGVSKAITSHLSVQEGEQAHRSSVTLSSTGPKSLPPFCLACSKSLVTTMCTLSLATWTTDRPLSGWRIVWVTATRAETVRQAALLPSQHGLVRSRNKFGVRVPSAHFGEAFKKLRPADNVPIEIEVKELFKLGPVPIGATSDKIAAWASDLKWPVRVLRSLGPAHWLLGASSSPPTECLCVNGRAVLLTRLPGRSQQAPVVIGHGPLKRISTPQPTQHQDPAEDPWDVQDPWSQYKGSKNKAESKAASASSMPSNRPPDTAQAARLQALEHGLATLQAQHQQSIRDREVEKQQVANEFRNLRGDMKNLHNTLSSQVQTSLDSLRAAQLQQEQQVKNGMDELKMLLLQTPAEKKQRKEPSHE